MGAVIDEQPQQRSNGDRTTVRLDIVTDLICPFAYIGHLKIAKAIEAAQKAALPIDVVVHHLPFQLDPTLPEDHAISRDERNTARFGEKWPAVEERINQQGSPVGWKYNSGGKVRQTTDVHRLLMLAYQRGGSTVQYPLMASLYTGFWDELQDPGDFDYLASEGVKAGLFAAEDEGVDWLAGDELRAEVKAACQQLRMRGVKGVPFTIVNGKYAICGAQDPEEILATFRKIAKGELKCPGAKSNSAAVCNPVSKEVGADANGVPHSLPQKYTTGEMCVVSTGASCGAD